MKTTPDLPEQAQEVQKGYPDLIFQKEGHLAKADHQVKEGLSETTDHAGHSEKVRTDHADSSERAASVQEDHSQAIRKDVRSVRAGHSEATDHADSSEKARTDLADRSERTESVQEGLSQAIRKDAHSVKAGHSEAKGKTEVSVILPRRVSTRRTSTISATRTRAESTR